MPTSAGLVSTLFLASAVVALASPPARAADAADASQADLVRATLLADATAAVPGGSFHLGVHLKIKAPWHTYWLSPGETGDATKVRLDGTPGLTFGPVRWPLPHKMDAPGGVSYGYENDVLLVVPVTVAQDFVAGTAAAVSADVSWLSCAGDECVPGGAKLTISVPVVAASGDAKPANRELFDAWRAKLPAASADAVATVEQPGAGGATPQSSFTVRWAEAPRKVEWWFPASSRAVSIDDVAVTHAGAETRVTFKPTVYKPAQVPPGGRVEGVLVYEDAKGARRGIPVAVRVAVPTAPAASADR